jgi:hypothetical protein
MDIEILLRKSEARQDWREWQLKRTKNQREREGINFKK